MKFENNKCIKQRNIKKIIIENKNIGFVSEIKCLDFIITPNLCNNLDMIKEQNFIITLMYFFENSVMLILIYFFKTHCHQLYGATLWYNNFSCKTIFK